MAILAYDDLILREPRLLVPKMAPVGAVKIASAPITATLTRVLLFGAKLDITKTSTTVFDDIVEGSPYGRVRNKRLGVTTLSTGNCFPSELSWTFGFITNAVSSGSGRVDVLAQAQGGSPYTQKTIALNNAGAGAIEMWSYSGGFNEQAAATGALDGNWHVFVCSAPASGVNPFILRDGVDITTSATSSTSAASTAAYPLIVNSTYGQILLACTWSRSPSKAELIEWSRDPFSIFVPA